MSGLIGARPGAVCQGEHVVEETTEGEPDVEDKKDDEDKGESRKESEIALKT